MGFNNVILTKNTVEMDYVNNLTSFINTKKNNEGISVSND